MRWANAILKGASAFFAAELDRLQKQMIEFIDQHRAVFGVEPICAQLQIAPATYYGSQVEAAVGPVAAGCAAGRGDRAGAPGQLRRVRVRASLLVSVAVRSPAGWLRAGLGVQVVAGVVTLS